MSKALIISDNIAIAYSINMKFSNIGWQNESVSIATMMQRGSASVRNLQCIVLVIDAEFHQRFSRTITEIGAIFRNCAGYTSLYLLFEDDTEPCFSAWEKYAKGVFKSVGDYHKLRNAIYEITRLEAEYVPVPIFCSPMSAF